MASKSKNNTGKAGKRQEKRPRNGKALRVLVLLLVLIASGVIGIYGYAIYGYHSIYPNVFIGSSGVSGPFAAAGGADGPGQHRQRKRACSAGG